RWRMRPYAMDCLGGGGPPSWRGREPKGERNSKRGGVAGGLWLCVTIVCVYVFVCVCALLSLVFALESHLIFIPPVLFQTAFPHLIGHPSPSPPPQSFPLSCRLQCLDGRAAPPTPSASSLPAVW